MTNGFGIITSLYIHKITNMMTGQCIMDNINSR